MEIIQKEEQVGSLALTRNVKRFALFTFWKAQDSML
jgi:hypothetical protein